MLQARGEAQGTRSRRAYGSMRAVVGSALLLMSCDQGSPLQTDNQPVVPMVPFDAGIVTAVDAAPAPMVLDAGYDAGEPFDAGAPMMQDAQLLPSTGVSYQKNIRAIMETSCLDCHTKGGIGPLPFDDWAMVQSASSLIVGAVTSGVMPPSGWNNDCQKLNEDRSLTPDQRALFTQWKEAGFPEGNAAEYVAPPARQKKALGEPTITMSMKEAYTPPAKADEYRCFLLDALPGETYLTGMQIIPGQADEVHHVIIHRVEEDVLAQVRSLDQSDPKPGYVCAGGAGVTAQNMFSYRPGSEAVTFDKGDAVYIAPGSSLVIQVHYNTVFLTNGKGPTPDQTKIAFWTLPQGQLPERVVYRTTTFGPINIAANAANFVSNISRPMNGLAVLGGTFGIGGTYIPGEVIGMTPHAHQLATKMNASLKRANGTSVCLDDVKWDFQWQLDYMFGQGVPYSEGDTFVASCTYDNSPANQPVINGVKQTSKAVAFGEKSTDEMCEHYIWLRFPRDAFLAARNGAP